MVGNKEDFDVVSIMNTIFRGGSSKILSNAFCASFLKVFPHKIIVFLSCREEPKYFSGPFAIYP